MGTRVLAAVALLATLPAFAGLQVELASGPGSIAGVRFERLALTRDGQAPPGAWQGNLEGLSHVATGPLGSLAIACDPDRETPCPSAGLVWIRPDGSRVAGRAGLVDVSGLALVLDGARIRLQAADGALALDAESVPLEWLPGQMLERLDLSHLGGTGDFRGTVGADRLAIRAVLSGMSLDTPDGSIAAEGAALDADVRWQPEHSAFEIAVVLQDGEWLLGPLYLPPPGQPVHLTATGFLDSGQVRVEAFRLEDAGRMALSGKLTAAGTEIRQLEVIIRELDLAAAWPVWLQSIASSRGFGALEIAGEIRGRLVWEGGALRELAVTAAEVDLDDGDGRFRIHGLSGGASFRDAQGRLESDLEWRDAGLFSVPLGGARLALETDDDGLVRLAHPLRIPILDGALEVERFGWRDITGEDALLELDAIIQPVNLPALTRALDLPELGGSLSGRFPGVQYADGVLAVDGGIDLNAFSGGIRIDGLKIERPFGPLPALAADVELERLDLLEVTGAFNFGRMEGLLSGRIDGLRLLDWQPVAFDARIATLEDSPTRRISQRAVDNLSSLGGGGGSAVLSGTFLRVFKDFPYRRVGIACRLVNNVCHMDGVAGHESGGYYIVQGRLLPRLDVIGHRRQVDWRRLVSQLVAVTAGQ